MYKLFLKRALDICLSALFAICISPVFFSIIVLLFLFNDGKVFFKQARPGKKGKIFTVVKFKTMNDRKNKNGKLLPDAERLTIVGRFLRKTSLDELPQLINLLKGDMSIVGPRPLLPEYLPLYSEEQMRRHDIRPGVTGWAQINGRNTISWQKKFELDVWYVRNVSFLLDIKILFLTAMKVLRRADVNRNSAKGKEITMPKFNGSN